MGSLKFLFFFSLVSEIKTKNLDKKTNITLSYSYQHGFSFKLCWLYAKQLHGQHNRRDAQLSSHGRLILLLFAPLPASSHYTIPTERQARESRGQGHRWPCVRHFEGVSEKLTHREEGERDAGDWWGKRKGGVCQLVASSYVTFLPGGPDLSLLLENNLARKHSVRDLCGLKQPEQQSFSCCCFQKKPQTQKKTVTKCIFLLNKKTMKR